MAEEKASRIIELENGEKVNFGARANLLSSFDTETNEITFKVATGEVIVWNIADIAGLDVAPLTEQVKNFVLYGLLAKIKTNLAPVKLQEEVDGKVVNSLAEAIQAQVAILNTGKFSVRGSGDDSVELSLDQKAFAVAASKEPVFATAVSLTTDETAGWADLDAEATINAVSTLWDSYDTSTKNAIRKNAYFRLYKATLELAK